MKRHGRLWLACLVAVELVAGTIVLARLFAPERAGRAAGLPATVEPAAAAATPAGVRPTPTARHRPVLLTLERIPGPLAQAVQTWAAAHTVEGGRASRADLAVGWQPSRDAVRLAEVVLVPAVPFPSLRATIGADELRAAWQGRARPDATFVALIVADDTAGGLAALWGELDPGSPVQVVPAAELAGRLRAAPGGLALVPFDRLEPGLQPLAVDGVSLLDRRLDPGRYPLALGVWAAGAEPLAASLAASLAAAGLDTNRHPERMTVVAMTGVTGLTRRMAIEIEARGDPGWPARRLADLLAAADVTHISNEVSFLPGCPPQVETASFCARPEYLEVLRLAGADVIELTGNHNLDFGPDYALLSLDLYAEAGMRTFGGGRDAAEAGRPLIVADHGNRLAFLGYNQFGPDYAWATAAGPGAAPFSLAAVAAGLDAIEGQADVVFVDIQHTESYSPEPLPEQVADFRSVARLGAGVVTGTQAHQPQAVEILDGRPIFYGLGNLFFEQALSDATRQGLIVRHTIYDGRLIAFELLPTVMDDDCRPRLADEAERRAILQTVFDAGAALAP